MFRENDERAVRELLAGLDRPGELALTLGPPAEQPIAGAREIDYAAEARRIVEGVAALAPQVTARVVEQAEPGRYPAIAVNPDGRDEGLRYLGLPWGYELASLVGACVAAGRRASELSPEALAALAALDGERALDVFVTPT
jgi:alkyl hydroperoxide reductase subunit AhpF